MPDRYLRILALGGGLLLIIFGLLWTVSLSFEAQLAENAAQLVIIASIGLTLIIIGWKE
ncbi:MAG: hypothetical protein JSW29_06755 [Candidatus Bathyarchaeota archaeon]|nr:MAG: hypothetical protein JSW29_06755 [Candidatus Bathyarchaeota archaeon]